MIAGAGVDQPCEFGLMENGTGDIDEVGSARGLGHRQSPL
jgi:hypothetical protein